MRFHSISNVVNKSATRFVVGSDTPSDFGVAWYIASLGTFALAATTGTDGEPSVSLSHRTFLTQKS
jgi:hypothetical protein